MQSAEDYLRKTESAVRLLFTGIDSYLQVLRQATGVVFVSGELDDSKREADFAAWLIENEQRLAAARVAERDFIAESFALDTLCGSILQVAGKALEVYGTNNVIPTGLPTTVKSHFAKFCVGRPIRTVPLGLVIYAARNQHTHFNDDGLREPSSSVFNLLATAHRFGPGIVDPAFDLKNDRLLSYASNISSLLDWRSYEQYIADMRSMLVA